MSELFDSLNFPISRASRGSRRSALLTTRDAGNAANASTESHPTAGSSSIVGESSRSVFTPRTSSRSTNKNSHVTSTPNSGDSQPSPPSRVQPAVYWHASPSPTLMPERRANPAPPMATQEFTSHLLGQEASASATRSTRWEESNTPSRPGGTTYSRAATSFKRARENRSSGRSSMDSPSDPPSLPRSISAPEHPRKRIKRGRMSRSGTVPNLSRPQETSGSSIGDSLEHGAKGRNQRSSEPTSSESEDRSARVQRMLLDLNEQLNSLGSGSDGERLGAALSDCEDADNIASMRNMAEERSLWEGTALGKPTTTSRLTLSRPLERSTSFPLERSKTALPPNTRTSPSHRIGLSNARSANDVFSSNSSSSPDPKKHSAMTRMPMHENHVNFRRAADEAVVPAAPLESTPPRAAPTAVPFRKPAAPPPALRSAGNNACNKSSSPAKSMTPKVGGTKSAGTAGSLSKPFVPPTSNKGQLRDRPASAATISRRAGVLPRGAQSGAVSMSQQFRSPLTRTSSNTSAKRKAGEIESTGTERTTSVRRRSHSPVKSSKISAQGTNALGAVSGANGAAGRTGKDSNQADLSSDDSFGLSFDMDIDELDRKMAEAEQGLA